MTRFAGVVDPSGSPAIADLVVAMAHHQSFAGPQALTIRREQQAAFAAQPIFPRLTSNGGLAFDADTGSLLVGDIRLDNRVELSRRHDLRHIIDGDEALLLALYRRWGPDCLRDLIGDFSFAIWDPKQRRLFCARDQFGVRPLNYMVENKRFRFASSTRALAAGAADRRAAQVRVAEFVAGASPPSDETWYRGAKSLPPGSYCIFDETGVSVQRYYELPTSLTVSAEPYEELGALLTEATRCRMEPAGRTGALLSGGLDSSSIALIAAGLSGPNALPLRTISRVFDDTPQWNERPYIERVLSCGVFDPTFLPSDSANPLAEVDQAIIEQDRPLLAPALTLTRPAYRSAVAGGVHVLLDGHGGDEVVSYGWGRLRELGRAGRLVELWRQSSGIAKGYNGSTAPLFMSALSAHPAGRIASRLRARARRIGKKVGDSHPPRWARYLDPEFLRISQYEEIRRERLRADGEPTDDEFGRHRHLLQDGQAYALEVLGLNASALGVEGRYPFWDKRLVEFCLGLESRFKLDHGWSRYILRRSMEGVLPPEVQWRRDKLDFTPHLIRGLLLHNRTQLDDIILRNADGVGRYINLSEVRLAYERLLASAENTDGYDVQAVIRTVYLSRWLAVAGDVVDDS